MDKRAFWMFFVMGAVLLTSLLARAIVPTPETRLALLAWQQLLFIVGGALGSRREVLKWPNLKTFTRGLFYGVGLFVVNALMGAMTVGIATQLLGNDLVQHLILKERAGGASLLASSNPLVVTGVILLLVLGAPLGEELFFRGLLTDLWKMRLGTWRAVLSAALFFAVLHFYLLQFIPVLLSGIILGALFVRTENISIPIVAHAVVNGLVLLMWLSL